MKNAWVWVASLVMGFTFAVVGDGALAQEARAVVEVVEPGCTDVHASFNGDGTVEGFACVRVASDGGETRRECGQRVRLAATVNQNRADGLCTALRRRAVRKFEPDAGGEP